MIEITAPIERAVLVGAPPADLSQAEVDEHLEELARLVDTAGAEATSVLVQRLQSPHPATYIGSGKVEQLRALARSTDATLVVFDEDLSPAQGTGLEKRLGVRVMDRTELILDIFALRARTAEARLQVELAQLEYMRPRLKRMWTHLSRTQGGIGTRGPGEQQIETDRRIIDQRISRLHKKLQEIAQGRQTRRKNRAGEFRVALVGYTNAGKSSILRELSGSDLFVEDRLFATLDSTTRAVDLGQGYTALATDTVGFIRKLPHNLVASFRATLEEVQEADLLLHVIDASHPGWEHQADAVDDVLSELGVLDREMLLVFNKVDQLTHDEEKSLGNRASGLFGPHVLSSVREDGGLDALRDRLQDHARRFRPTVQIILQASDGQTLAEAYRETEVIDRRYEGTTIVLTVRAPKAVIGRWRQHPGVRVTAEDAP